MSTYCELKASGLWEVPLRLCTDESGKPQDGSMLTEDLLLFSALSCRMRMITKKQALYLLSSCDSWLLHKLLKIFPDVFIAHTKFV